MSLKSEVFTVQFRFLFVFILLLTVYFACNSSAKHPVYNKVHSTKESKSVQSAEYLDWDKVKINGIIPMISSFEKVVKQLGKPDKVDTLAEGANGSFYHRKFQYCYFKALTFEKYNDTLVFSSINFSKWTNYYLTDGKHIFDRSFRDSDFKKQFPYSFDNNELHGTSMDKYLRLSLPVSPKKANDNWFFLFNAEPGKLLTIDHDDARNTDELK